MGQHVEDIKGTNINLITEHKYVLFDFHEKIKTCHVSKSQMNGSSPNKSAKASQAWNKKNNAIQHLRHDRKMDQQYLQSSQERSWI